jgi:hypothetical protein
VAVRAEIDVGENYVNITVSDDGHGFPFQGQYDHTDLTKMNLGPVTLKERIAALGGSLAIDSSDTGTRLEITLPLTEQYNSIGTHPIFRSIPFLVFLSGAVRAFFQAFFPSRPQTPHYQEAFPFL